MTDPSCYYGCGKTTELRPYGPGGNPVCFDCAMATPERKAITDRAFEAVVNAAQAASPTGEVLLNEDGISPL